MIVLHRRGTTDEWQKADLAAEQLPEVLLKDGEFAIEEREDGSCHVKVGNGHSKFFELPYIDERAEKAVSKALNSVETTLTKKLTELKQYQNNQLNNAKLVTEQLIKNEVANLATIVETDRKNAINEVDRRISTETDSLRKDLNNYISTTEDNIASISSELTKAERRVNDNLAVVRSSLDSKITKELNSLSDSLVDRIETDISAVTAKVNADMLNNVSNMDSRFNTVTSEIEALDSKVMPAITTVNRKLDKSVTDISALSKKHASDITNLTDLVSNKYTELDARLTKYIGEHAVVLANKETELNDNIATAVSSTSSELKDLLASTKKAQEASLLHVKTSLEDKLAANDRTYIDNLAEVQSKLQKVDKELDENFTTHCQQYKEVVSDILSQLSLLKDQTEKLTRADININDLIKSIKIHFTSITEGLAADLNNIDVKYDTKCTNLSNSVKEEVVARINAINEVQRALKESVEKIYADLAAMADDDVFILETVFYVKNKLLNDIKAVETALNDKTQVINESISQLTVDFSEADKQLGDRITSETDSINNKFTMLEDTVNTSIRSAVDTFNTKINALTAADPEVSPDINTTAFISSIQQENGVITAVKARLPVADENTAGITTLGIEGGAATYDQAKENALEISQIKNAIAGGVHFIGIVVIPTNLATASDVGRVTLATGTEHVAALGDIVLQDGKEFIWADNTWQEFGDISFITEQLKQLTVPDTAVTSQFITKVSQLDGKVSVERSQPTIADIKYNNDSTLAEELQKRTENFTELASHSIQYDNINKTIFIGENVVDTIIFCGGDSTDI